MHSAKLAASLLFASLFNVHAVIVLSTGDPSCNTTAPTGPLAGSGWDLQGTWGSFLGTPIAPNFFLSASHVGGSIGDTFTFQGNNYTTTALFDDPNTDLRVWQVSGTFPSYAPIYSGSDELGKSLVVFGRGTQRGAELTISGGVGGDSKGWGYGAGDGLQRWGENVVSDVVNGGAGLGTFLQAQFNQSGGANEATLSGGDSGGGVFIKEGGVWKLAGINYGVEGPFSTSPTGTSPFNAALFDKGGYYQQDINNVWVLNPDTLADNPAAFVATRVSERQGFITSVTAVPEVPYIGAVSGTILAFFALGRRVVGKFS